MKYVVILPDGVADVPLASLGNKTPLEVAQHPHLDRIAREGIAGLARTIPEGLKPGSDVGCMSVFGYDPRQYYTGRAPLEAAARGIALSQTDVAFRCNTVTVTEGVMADYSAGHIETDAAAALMKTANERLRKYGMQFHAGVGYRHLAVIAGSEYARVVCTPPHDISGRAIEAYLPKGLGSELLREVMEASVLVLRDHPVNKRRIQEEKTPATMLWFWGQGTTVAMPSFRQVYGLRGACISAVDIVRGLGRLLQLTILEVPGITGYFDTDYRAKATYALKALDTHDFVLIHIEPTDEAGHMGDVRKKIQAIEDTDRLLVGTLLEGLQRRGEPHAVMVVPDHPTSTALKTHTADPVPFAIFTPGGRADGVTAYTESAVKRSGTSFADGFQLMSFFLKQGTHA